MGFSMYHKQYSIWSITIIVSESLIIFAIYSIALLNLSYALALIIPTISICFMLAIQQWRKNCSQSRKEYWTFWKQHVAIIQMFLKSNDIIIYGSINIVLLFNVPINSYLVTYMTFFSIPNAQKFIFLAIITIHLTGFIFFLSILAMVNRMVANSRKCLERILFCIAAQNIRIKWKYLTYCEFLRSRPNIGYTLFPFGTITYKLIIEVWII